MCGLEVYFALCLVSSSYLQGYCPFEVQEIYIEVPVYIAPESPQFQAFISSVDLKTIIESLETLTSTPNFPYLTTEEIQTLSEVARKLRLLEYEEEGSYCLDE
ncbi:MAG: hypothetical protein ABR980_12790 [Ignavibacteriaceae bacterium]